MPRFIRNESPDAEFAFDDSTRECQRNYTAARVWAGAGRSCIRLGHGQSRKWRGVRNEIIQNSSRSCVELPAGTSHDNYIPLNHRG